MGAREEREQHGEPLQATTRDSAAVDEPARPRTSSRPATQSLLTQDFIMTRLGVYEPAATKELILRDEEIVGVDEGCAQSLIALEILSLSHNKLVTLDGFQYFVNLIELNLNFNSITSLAPLQCPGLEKLFISSNRVNISPLKPFTKLTTISVYGNLITDLNVALQTCRAMPKLLEESAVVDVELTELILQNEVALELIKNEIKSTKKEWEEQFRLAKDQERERQRLRPKTSLGLSHSSSLNPTEPVTVTDAPSTLQRVKQQRLHTSAGFRHGGPEAVLLSDQGLLKTKKNPLPMVKESSSSSRLETNILTL
ncbi:hypothetical protein P43SY_009206 [Pythium insidiosum]|uniref:Uncharacterized protein n=1 Tax=Pythium insidiosum TaxID=114742 RepID=A0AAD5MHG3_PYTIN|nr:hypothetical protein P43SY_009206 [Pythium insidiosum]